MSKIKKYFMDKKAKAQFKLKLGGNMGEGRALNSSKPEPSSSQAFVKDAYVPPNRNELSTAARAAASAALARTEKKDSKQFNTSLAAIKAQAKRELEAERKLKETAELSATPSNEVQGETSSENRNLACSGVYFRCPLISEEVLSRQEWKIKIKEFLYQQLEVEPALTSILIIYNCNTKEKTEECVKTLTKYLENIINYPDEEKYCKIRMSNRIFSEKVRYVEGALEFLLAAGFQQVELDNEPFLLWSKDQMEQGHDLPSLLEALQNGEIIQLELDRNIKVLLPSQTKRTHLPADFYRISPEELKREQQQRTEALENAQVLRTKAMRERDEKRDMRIYRYALVRVKFPNGIYIQGTFGVHEKLNDIYEFVQSCLIDENLLFQLSSPQGFKFKDEEIDKSLFELHLIPQVVLNFIPKDLPLTTLTDVNFLKEELLLLVESL